MSNDAEGIRTETDQRVSRFHILALQIGLMERRLARFVHTRFACFASSGKLLAFQRNNHYVSITIMIVEVCIYFFNLHLI